MIELAKIRKKSRKRSAKRGTDKKTAGKAAKKAKTKPSPTPPPIEEETLLEATPPEQAETSGQDPETLQESLLDVETPGDALPLEDEEIVTSLHFAIRNEHCALPIDDIVEVIDVLTITPVPNASQDILGIISLRGIVVAVIDMGQMLDHEVTRITEESKIIILKKEDNYLGFLVDRVFRTLPVPINSLEQPPVKGEWGKIVKGLYSHEKKIIMILEGDKLV